MKFTIVALSALLCLNAFAAKTADKSDAALDAAAEQLIAEARAEEGSGDNSMEMALIKDAAPTKASTEPKESEIPVVLSGTKSAADKGNGIWRLCASLAVIAVTAAVALYASKRWARKKDKGGQKARIEMMHQMHLGPRKSVGLIRVAGEAMLVGITDHNINLIKSVTLIDDELAHVANKDFNGFLEEEFTIEDVRNALGTQP